MFDVEAWVVLGVVAGLCADGDGYELFEVTFRDIVRGLDFDCEGVNGHFELSP